MKNFIAVVSSAAGKITKFQDFDIEADADAHVILYGGFVAPSPGDNWEYWVVDDVAETLTYDAATEAADSAARAQEAADQAAARQAPPVSTAVSIPALRDEFNALVAKLTVLGILT